MSKWSEQLKRKAAEPQQQPAVPAEVQTSAPPAAEPGWTHDDRRHWWIRTGLSAHDLQAAMRQVNFFEPTTTIDILICKPRGESS